MKRFSITLTILIIYSMQLLSQKIDTVLFRKTAINYLEYYLKTTRKEYLFPWKHVPIAVSDTNNIKLYLPVLLLNEIPNDQWNYSVLSHYIDKKLSPHNQNVIIKNNSGYVCLAIDRDQSRNRLRNALEKIGLYTYESDQPIISCSEGEISRWDIVLTKTKYSDIRIHYKQVVEYANRNKEVTLIIIEGLPGIWGFKNNKLIKLEFTPNEVKEFDGEKYYREVLFPLSPEGIKEVIEGNDFFVIFTG